jgi:hypothetical protein
LLFQFGAGPGAKADGLYIVTLKTLQAKAVDNKNSYRRRNNQQHNKNAHGARYFIFRERTSH